MKAVRERMRGRREKSTNKNNLSLAAESDSSSVGDTAHRRKAPFSFFRRFTSVSCLKCNRSPGSVCATSEDASAAASTATAITSVATPEPAQLEPTFSHFHEENQHHRCHFALSPPARVARSPLPQPRQEFISAARALITIASGAAGDRRHSHIGSHNETPRAVCCGGCCRSGHRAQSGPVMVDSEDEAALPTAGAPLLSAEDSEELVLTSINAAEFVLRRTVQRRKSDGGAGPEKRQVRSLSEPVTLKVQVTSVETAGARPNADVAAEYTITDKTEYASVAQNDYSAPVASQEPDQALNHHQISTVTMSASVFGIDECDRRHSLVATTCAGLFGYGRANAAEKYTRTEIFQSGQADSPSATISNVSSGLASSPLAIKSNARFNGGRAYSPTRSSDVFELGRAKQPPAIKSTDDIECGRANPPTAIKSTEGLSYRQANPTSNIKPTEVFECGRIDLPPEIISSEIFACSQSNQATATTSSDVFECGRANPLPATTSSDFCEHDLEIPPQAAKSTTSFEWGRANPHPVVKSTEGSGCGRANVLPAINSATIFKCGRVNPLVIIKLIGLLDRDQANPPADTTSTDILKCGQAWLPSAVTSSDTSDFIKIQGGFSIPGTIKTEDEDDRLAHRVMATSATKSFAPRVLETPTNGSPGPVGFTASADASNEFTDEEQLSISCSGPYVSTESDSTEASNQNVRFKATAAGSKNFGLDHACFASSDSLTLDSMTVGGSFPDDYPALPSTADPHELRSDNDSVRPSPTQQQVLLSTTTSFSVMSRDLTSGEISDAEEIIAPVVPPRTVESIESTTFPEAVVLALATIETIEPSWMLIEATATEKPADASKAERTVTAFETKKTVKYFKVDEILTASEAFETAKSSGAEETTKASDAVKTAKASEAMKTSTSETFGSAKTSDAEETSKASEVEETAKFSKASDWLETGEVAEALEAAVDSAKASAVSKVVAVAKTALEDAKAAEAAKSAETAKTVQASNAMEAANSERKLKVALEALHAAKPSEAAEEEAAPMEAIVEAATKPDVIQRLFVLTRFRAFEKGIAPTADLLTPMQLPNEERFNLACFAKHAQMACGVLENVALLQEQMLHQSQATSGSQPHSANQLHQSNDESCMVASGVRLEESHLVWARPTTCGLKFAEIVSVAPITVLP